MPAPVNPSRQRLPGGLQGGLYSGGYYGSTKTLRKDDAKERAEYRDNLTAEQQLARLDKRLGIGIGAKRERAALAKQIAGRKK
mgnify:CR=1 FL=1